MSSPAITAWFEKELPDQPLYLNGRAYRFHLLETSDAALIKGLNSAADNRVGGVIKLTQEEFNKKKANPSPASLTLPGKREEVRQKVITSQPLNWRQRRGVSAAVSGKLPQEGADTPQQAVQDDASFIPQPVKGVFE